MTETARPARRLPLVLVGVVLLLIAAGLLAAVLLPRPRSSVDADAEARAGCRAFDDVYGATQPGTPLDGEQLADRLESAIDHMQRAASAEDRYGALARSLDDVGRTVNAGNAPAAFAAMQVVRRDCDDLGADRAA